VLLIILNIYTIGLSLDECIPSIIYLILFALDFYIIYVKEDKVLPMTIAFGVYGFFSMVKLIAGIDSIYYLVAALVYLVYLLITRKNKVIFGISLGLFIANLAYYIFEVIPNETISGLIFELLIAMGIVLFQHECLTKPADKLVFIAVTTGIQIGFTILLPVNILLKIFALVEAIVLIAVSMIDDEYKSLYEEGLIGVVISLIFIIGTIDNLPKSLYLIIVGLVIIVTVPIVIKRYIKRYEMEKALAKNKPKEEVQATQESKKIEFTSNGKKIEYHNNFCGACGTKVFDAYDFCPTCGNKLK
ncbi:MAG: zinc ribbon domain-containing protein, partial [Bacilli bacterium]|nr:zinc ribbon domain-containing protein [Bacilli bacterium]